MPAYRDRRRPPPIAAWTPSVVPGSSAGSWSETALARVIVVCRHPLVRYGLRFLLREGSGIRLVAEVATLADAARLLVHTAPQILLVDADVIDGEVSCAQVLREIRCRRPSCRIVAFVDTGEVPRMMAWLNDIACVLDRNSIGVDLADILRKAQLRYEIDPDTADSDGSAVVVPYSPDPSVRLTRRESEVLGLLVMGGTNSGIARDLDISPATVKFHVRGLMRKLGAGRRAEAAYRAISLGLLGAHNQSVS